MFASALRTGLPQIATTPITGRTRKLAFGPFTESIVA